MFTKEEIELLETIYHETSEESFIFYLEELLEKRKIKDKEATEVIKIFWRYKELISILLGRYLTK